MYIEIDSKKYWVEQEGRGEPLVLLHGFTGLTKTWSPFIQQWSKNFHVISIDLPGHGKTKAYEPFSIETVCDDIYKIMNRLDLDNIHLLGYSMGGRTALSFACLYPQCVESLILESSSPGLKTVDEQENRRKWDEKLAIKLENEGLFSFVSYWTNIPLFETQKHLPKQIQNQLKQERLSHNAKGLAASLRYMGTGSQPSWWNQLEKLTFKVLLITGELDEKFTALNREMVNLLPNGEHQLIKDAGHAIHVEEPQIFGKIVSDFILHK
ncbi:2-succinyl-6-hydroxy-2,4-cyclohexadiene-1-carboxylate synthase [Salinibacillus kushneri]|uniref:Putative 2-succinyl-6-hydroxy-2,4-cyclohexadiene-1-carboxylate synthase n=1 Tax=Salinibacillus kushneri TaxID=237682 RepID=A0A1H9Y5N1_9BACI|nr:2-succinyl-6-hydroxy-2,4-cyclohexadiene-1-carboxylate synthase [Salinibacillus kushneri]SES64170.1 2-succinyl-6-hydroxy-2,4-cyclohexadiene-1-carboxylate synthase [Salinibacillus kushneri]